METVRSSERADRLRLRLCRDGWVEAQVTGDSMWPTLRPGEVVRLEPASRLRRGDVVAFERAGGLLIHRVVRTGADGVVCRGDNRIADDGLTRFEEVIGRVVEARSVDGGDVRPLPGGMRGWLCAAASHRRRRLRLVLWRLAQEGRLLARQVRGETAVWRRDDLGSRLHGTGVSTAAPGHAGPDVEDLHVLVPAELAEEGETLAVAPGAPRLIVPADIYSFLPEDARRALVASRLAQGPAAERTIVAAFARGPRARVARVTAALRRALAAAGVPAGRPGDAVVAGRAWPEATYVRFFTAGELADELRAAGAEVLRVTPVSVRGVALWHAEIRSSSGTT